MNGLVDFLALIPWGCLRLGNCVIFGGNHVILVVDNKPTKQVKYSIEVRIMYVFKSIIRLTAWEQ